MAAFNIVKHEIKKHEISESLKKARLAKKLSLEDAEKATKIRIKYLKALEDENWSKIPCQAYIAGFLQSYAKFLKIPAQPLVEAFQKKMDIKEKITGHQITERREIKFTKIYFTPTILIVAFLVIIFLGVLGYIVFQVSGFASAPYLIIKSPSFGAIIEKSPVMVEGKTAPAATLYLNGQLISSDSEGNFQQEVNLKDGENNIVLAAQSRTGKKSEKTLTIIYKEGQGG